MFGKVFASVGHAAIEEHEQEHEPAVAAAAEPPRKKQRTRGAKHHMSLVPELGRQTSCSCLAEEGLLEDLSEVPRDLRQCARGNCVPMEVGWPWQRWWKSQEDQWCCG